MEVRRFTDTVYLDVTMDGMTATARSVVAYGGEYRTLWDDSMERLKELNQQYWDIMVNDFDLKKEFVEENPVGMKSTRKGYK